MAAVSEVEEPGRPSPPTLDEVAQREASHKLLPYGSSPRIEETAVAGRPARLILPSPDQLPAMERLAALIVDPPRPPRVGGVTYRYLVLWADRDHVRAIAATAEFIAPAGGE